MIVPDSLYPVHKRGTWKCNFSKQWREVDYFAISSKAKHMVKRVYTKDTSVVTDHKMKI